jgi:hypothetical protein
VNFLRESGQNLSDPLLYKPVPDSTSMFDFREPIQESHFSQGYMKRILGYFEEAGIKMIKEVINY